MTERKGGSYPEYSGHPTTCVRCGNETVTSGKRKFGGEQFISAAPGSAYYANHAGQGPDWVLRQCLRCGHCWAEELPAAEAARMFAPELGAGA